MFSGIRRGVLLALAVLFVAVPHSALASTRGVTFTDPQDEVVNPNGPTRADIAGGTIAYEDSYGTIGVSVSFWRPVSESPPGDGSQGYSAVVEFFSSTGSDCGAPSETRAATLWLHLNRTQSTGAIYGNSNGQYFYSSDPMITSEDGRTLSGVISNPVLANQDLRCVSATVRYSGYPPSTTSVISYDGTGPIFFDGYAPLPPPPPPPPPPPVVRPNTLFTNTPLGSGRRITFRFKSKPRGATFECLYPQDWRNCSSPETFRHLKPGRYRFKVRALLNGVRDRTPASWDFRIDK